MSQKRPLKEEPTPHLLSSPLLISMLVAKLQTGTEEGQEEMRREWVSLPAPGSLCVPLRNCVWFLAASLTEQTPLSFKEQQLPWTGKEASL